MRVSDLIDQITHKWDRNLLQGLFIPNEAKLIASIPICLNKVEDEVVWPFTPSGCYTVKSGSNLLSTTQCRTQQTSHTPNNNGLWKMIWGLSVPSKIWDSIPSLDFRQAKSFQSIRKVLTFTHEEQKNIELMAMVMWTIWHRRNQVRTLSKDYPLSHILHAASEALATFHQAISDASKQIHQSHPISVRWSPPPVGRIKVNFDGALFKDIGKAGIGVIIRDSNGQALASMSEQASLPFSPDIAEAMAAARAVSFAQELGYTSFILEGDSANIIATLSSEETSLSTYGHILSSAKATLGADSCISFSHVRRSGNCVAHNLAKHARHVRGFSVWTEDVPPHLIPIILADQG
ncbi:uncharacterized protein LOC142634963 [Castanea sativa]|uniref:uncharacterized protein LOC142634963 n=1 Tax=Castanea sativa TaxID=21020 RepID=UPI003F64B92A